MSELFHRILQPSDSWEKTSGSTAINEERINTAFCDPSLYTVTPPSERKSVSEDVQNDTIMDKKRYVSFFVSEESRDLVCLREKIVTGRRLQ